MTAADNYAAWLRGEDSEAADVGGMELAELVHLAKAFILAHDERNVKKTQGASRLRRR